MNTWLNEYCTGWICVPYKSHPFGNEYHIITDGDFEAALIWCCKLCEGKDGSSLLGKKKWDKKGSTFGLILRMMAFIHQTGKIVTHHSCFCVTAGILELHNFGVFGQALLKKWGRCWLCNVPENFISEHFHEKDIGSRESLKKSINGIDFLSIVKRRRICCKNHVNSLESE